ncbi:MAG TPA: hypothetical protein DCL75_06630 [Ktedonobacter sp.]|nr:hypothetical protein [Ktedonobacter sp.]
MQDEVKSMVKTVSKENVTSSPNGAKKQRKKQARQEAKAMLKLEQAKKNEQKAVKKVSTAQEQLDARRTRIHKIEARLAEMRSSHDETNAPETSQNGQVHQPDTANTLSSASEQDSSPSSSENHASTSSSQDNEEASSPQGEDGESAHEQETASPEAEDHTGAWQEQETSSPADDYTYIPGHANIETSSADEGQRD